MENPEDHTGFPTSMSEVELYRHFAAASASGAGGEGVLNSNFCRANNSCASFDQGGWGIRSETTESKVVSMPRVLHKEAEKRRRERINSHLHRLRDLLPCTSKTDKATLLSKVVQRVAELKRQASNLPPLENLIIPSENDEFHVYIPNNNNNNNNNIDDYNEEDTSSLEDDHHDNDNSDRIILKASWCCEDRPDLFMDLTQALRSLNLKTLRAELSSLGGRTQGVLVVAGDYDKKQRHECVVFLRDALKDIVQRSGSEDRLKRRRRVCHHANC